MALFKIARFALSFRAASWGGGIALVTALIIGGLSELRLYTAAHQAGRQFGEALAHQLALATAPMLVNKDTVSLQSVLSDAVRSPVAHISVQNMQSQVLAEAGQADADLDSYSSPITFQDATAGKIIVGIDASQNRAGAILRLETVIITGLVLIGVAGFITLLGWRRVGSQLEHITRYLQGSGELPALSNAEDELGALALAAAELNVPPRKPVASNGPTGAVVCAVAIDNIEQVFKQLSAQELETLLNKLRSVAEDVVALYDGEISGTTDAGFSLRFKTAPGREDPVFRAICCAKLVFWLFPRAGGRNVLTAGIAREPQAASLLLAQLAARRAIRDAEELAGIATPGELLVTPSCAREPGLSERTLLEPMAAHAAGSLRLARLHEPFLSLLKRQYQQLGGQGAPGGE